MTKAQPSPFSHRNQLLARLAPDDHQRFLARLQPVKLKFNQVLYNAGAPVDFAYFPNTGVLSALTVMQNGDAIEVGTIGNEGMADSTAFLGNRTTIQKL